MKWLKKGLLLLLVFGVLMGIVGCTFWIPETEAPAPTKEPVKDAHKSDPANFVKFSRSTEPRERYVSVPDLLAYESQYPDCNGTWFQDQLSGEDLIIYKSYLYALENRFIAFTLYVENSDKDFSYIRELISLDSPFLEQNYTYYEAIWKQPINYIGKSIMVSMEQFTDSRWEMKMEALAKCRQIVQNIPPEYETQQAKMEYLYDYVCENVEYVHYESMADESYFYDAVCKGKTICDGYSNMLSLLFRMVGVECCEVIGYNAEEQSGHTWVVAKLDGVFYNFDPTFEDTNEIQLDCRKFFAFSDELVSVNRIRYEEMRPKCTDTSRDFVYVDMMVSNFTDWDAVKKIATVAEERLDKGVNTTLICVKSPVDSSMYDLFLDRFAIFATKSKEINLSGWPMGNSALIEVTLTPRIRVVSDPEGTDVLHVE